MNLQAAEWLDLVARYAQLMGTHKVENPGAGDVPQHQDIVQFRSAGDA